MKEQKLSSTDLLHVQMRLLFLQLEVNDSAHGGTNQPLSPVSAGCYSPQIMRIKK